MNECLGERLVLMGATLPKDGVERRVSLRGGEPIRPVRTGSTATAPGSAPADFFLLDGGMREAGRAVGVVSFSMARYTRCMA